VINPATMLFGPLAGPECRRASSRGWLIWVRTLVALAATGVALSITWYLWFSQRYDPSFKPPTSLFRVTLALLEGMAVTIALVMSPAVLAGSLAGEKERGTLGLLLTTRMTAREIVWGRLIGRLAQVGMILLAGLPALVLMAAMAGFGIRVLATIVVLPMALAFGGGGLAMAASVLSRRGRDALLLVYFLDVMFLVSPLFLGPGALLLAGSGWAANLNPYGSLEPLVWDEELAPAMGTIAAWTVLGLAGLLIAAWRLRPACLALADGQGPRKGSRKRGWVPPIEERPMLWKELYIERAGSLGRAGRWLGMLLVVLLGGGGLVLAGIAAWNLWVRHDLEWEQWAVWIMSIYLGRTSTFVAWLIQWAIGLRAGVAISSERERGTWDALLTSPLTAGELVAGKLWGSLYALRWVVGAALLAWSVCWLLGAMTAYDYVTLLANVFIVGAYMAAMGVRTSMRTATATRAMAVTIGLWIAGIIVAAVLATAVCLGMVLLILIFGLAAMQLGLSTLPGPLLFSWFGTAWTVLYYVIFAIVTALVIAETRLRFDRVAGRMTAGTAALAVDRFMYGAGGGPVPINKPVAEPARVE
jgi:ABC-type transport system involved in multi-copper enzyme maturation permease subunit